MLWLRREFTLLAVTENNCLKSINRNRFRLKSFLRMIYFFSCFCFLVLWSKFIQLCDSMIILIFSVNSSHTSQWENKNKVAHLARKKMRPTHHGAVDDGSSGDSSSRDQGNMRRKSWHSIISDWIYSIVIAPPYIRSVDSVWKKKAI